MINQVWNYVEELHMFEKNDYVVAGVSGGADSVCLLYVLLELKKRIPMTVHVVHVNHGIREEAGEDAAYVEGLCKKYELPFTLVEEQVEELAKKLHVSTEEAGRQVRYQAFHRVLSEYAGDRRGRIAVAHNKNDSCETFLFHLFRGSGLKGLSGIRPVREEIVRPLLCLERAQIEQYLNQNHISFCIDKTNYEDNYTRNRIRHHILPSACELVSSGAVSHIKEAADKINDACELIEDMTQDGYDTCVRKDEKGYHISKEALFSLHKTLRSYVLLEVLTRASGSGKNLESGHVEQMLTLFEKQCGRELALPYGLKAVREYDGICLRKHVEEESQGQFSYVIGEEEKKRLERGEAIVVALPDGGELFCNLLTAGIICETGILDTQLEKNIPVKPYTKWFDYDKIKDNIVVRTRKTGDYLTVNSMNQRKTLKAYFVNAKVPKEERDRICLVTEGSHVIWIIGNRISSYYKVSGTTERILQILYRGGAEKWPNT